MGIFLEQPNTAHDHAGRAVGALESTSVEKSLLHGMKLAVALEAFDGGDRFGCSSTSGNLAGAAWGAGDQDRASTTLTFAAAVFRASQAEFVAEDLEERSFRIRTYIVSAAVDFEWELRRHTRLLWAAAETDATLRCSTRVARLTRVRSAP